MILLDFAFAWEHASGPDGPWGHLHVVRFDGMEQLPAHLGVSGGPRGGRAARGRAGRARA